MGGGEEDMGGDEGGRRGREGLREEGGGYLV